MNKIANSIYKNEKLRIFGDGSTARDYTYVDDIVLGIDKALNYKNTKFEVFNLGNGKPVKLSEIIQIFEKETKQNVNTEFVDSIKGESDITWADNSRAKKFLGFTPIVDISNGVNKFLKWYKEELKWIKY